MIRSIWWIALFIFLSTSAYAVLPYGMEVQVDFGKPYSLAPDAYQPESEWRGSHVVGGGLTFPLTSQQSPSQFSLSARLHGAYYRFQYTRASVNGYPRPIGTTWYSGIFGGLQLGIPSPSKIVRPYTSASVGYLRSHLSDVTRCFGCDILNPVYPESGAGAEGTIGTSFNFLKHQSIFVEGMAVTSFSRTSSLFWGIRTGIGIR